MSKIQENLPKGWKLTQLRDIARVNPSRAFDLPDDAKVTFLAMPDVTEEGSITNRQEKTVAEVKSGFTHFTDGDILVAKITPCFENGKGALVSGMTNGVGFGSTEFHVIRPIDKDDREFIFYHTTSHEFRVRGELHMVGSAGQKRVPADYLREYTFGFPPINERNRITEALRTWDDAIILQARQLQQLRRRKDGIAQELLSQRKHLPGFDETLSLASAGSIFSPVSVRGHEQEELLSVTQEQGVLPRSMLEGRVVMPEGTTAGYKLVEPGNFVISLRSFQGGIEYSEYRGLVSPAYTVLRSSNQAVPEYYKHYFKSTDFISRLASAVIGIRDGKQISFKDFAIINIPHPRPEEQTAIAEVLDTAEAEIRLHERKLDALREQKRGLLQRLLTGQILLS